jgi:hypothetical protein
VLDDPGELLRRYGGPDRPPAQRLTRELLVTAWQAPWEKARAERIVRATAAGRLRGVEAGYPAVAARLRAEEVPPSPGWWALQGWLPPDTGPGAVRERERLVRLLERSWIWEPLMVSPDLPLAQAASLCWVRGTRLQVALVLHQAREGKPAEALDALVPRTVRDLPRDPFSPQGQGFSYRLSEGEDIEWAPPQLADESQGIRHVPPGAGIVWSDGVDLTDNGGHRQDTTVSLTAAQPGPSGADWIFVVPRWTKR